MGENPVLSDPEHRARRGLGRGLEFLAVQDLFLTETARWADVVLPGSSFAEKEGTSSTPTGTSSSSRRRCPPPGEARRDLDILIDLSNRLGLPTAYTGPGGRDGGDREGDAHLAGRQLRHACGELRSLQYPVPDAGLIRAPRSSSTTASPRPTGRARFVAVEYLPPDELPSDEYPFVLNTGRQMITGPGAGAGVTQST